MASVPQPTIRSASARTCTGAWTRATSRRCGRCSTTSSRTSRPRPASRRCGSTATRGRFLMEAGKLITAEEADPPRADPREPGHARRVVHHAEPVRRAAAHPAGRDRAQPPPRSRRCASSSRAPAPTPRSTASAPRCTRATSSSRRPGPGTTTATRATSRWCGSTGSTSASCRLRRAVPREPIPKRCSR
jgi:hypothetical protein